MENKMEQQLPQQHQQSTQPLKQTLSHSKSKRLKLKPLIISLCPKRQSQLTTLFSHPALTPYFEPPTFTPGIPQRDLRNSYKLIQHAGEAGILPPAEWNVLSSPETREVYEQDPTQLFAHLETVLPDVEPGRRGGEFDVGLHYAKELWQKAKGVNRDRSVLACGLAHLKAMRVLVEGGFDFILEDNVRCPIGMCGSVGNDRSRYGSDVSVVECARRIYEARDASLECQEETGIPCHLRYYGWLGSKPNLNYVIHQHCPKTVYQRKDNQDAGEISVFPFPVSCFNYDDDEERVSLDQSLSPSQERQQSQQRESINQETRAHSQIEGTKHQGQPQKIAGGTLLWGAYAYWISREAHGALLSSLQKDVGALLWKGKRMRCHKVKPIDKVLPRRIIAEMKGGTKCVHVASHPAFFRAPMLTSQIHSQWDAEFCKSTEYQMSEPCVEAERDKHILTWDDLWLSMDERSIVKYKSDYGVWLTMSELKNMQCTSTLQA